MSNTSDFNPEIQVDTDHYVDDYDDIRRWSSYWWQLQLASRHINDGPILEIGIGNGLTSHYLRSVLGAQVVTLDIDPDLKPDIVADVASLPFEDNSFACVVACEVLEHTPYAHTEKALSEFRRVARHAVISVPDANRFVFRLRASLGSVHRPLINMDLNRFLPKAPPLESGGEHYWELNRENMTLDTFINSIRNAGWSVEKNFRNPDFQYHHFFLLK